MKNQPIGIRRALEAAQAGKCCYCGDGLLPTTARWKKAIHPKAQTIEHLHRKADGGSGHRDNKALACYEYNSRRGSVDWLTYKSIRMGELTF